MVYKFSWHFIGLLTRDRLAKDFEKYLPYKSFRGLAFFLKGFCRLGKSVSPDEILFFGHRVNYYRHPLMQLFLIVLGCDRVKVCHPWTGNKDRLIEVKQGSVVVLGCKQRKGAPSMDLR